MLAKARPQNRWKPLPIDREEETEDDDSKPQRLDIEKLSRESIYDEEPDKGKQRESV